MNKTAKRYGRRKIETPWEIGSRAFEGFSTAAAFWIILILTIIAFIIFALYYISRGALSG